MSEEQTAPSACPHPEAIGKRWGDPISEERQAKLMDVLDDRERTERELDMILSPLAFEHLSGADLFWLSKHARIPISRDTNELHLEQANLHGSHLEGAQLAEVYLQSADLKGAHLEKADLHLAHLEGAHLTGAHLESAFLYYTFLMRADLSDAHLEQSDLREAHLEVANLDGANLEGAILSNAHLGGANFQGTIFDGATMLNEVILVDTRYGAFRVADARWGDVNLAVVSDWSPFTERGIPVGDERMAAEWKRVNFTETEKERQRPREIRARERRRHDAQQVKTQRNLFLAAVRANRQLAIALRAQGMNEQADY